LKNYVIPFFVIVFALIIGLTGFLAIDYFFGTDFIQISHDVDTETKIETTAEPDRFIEISTELINDTRCRIVVDRETRVEYIMGDYMGGGSINRITFATPLIDANGSPLLYNGDLNATAK